MGDEALEVCGRDGPADGPAVQFLRVVDLIATGMDVPGVRYVFTYAGNDIAFHERPPYSVYSGLGGSTGSAR